MDNSRLTQLINGALRNNDNVQRANYEALIVDYRNQHTLNFLIGCAEVLVDNNYDQFTRQSAATLLGRSISMRTGLQDNPFFWDLIPQDAKAKVKEMALSVLVCPQPVIMRSGANVISHIALVEIPRGEWLSIAGTLAENTVYHDINIRKASIVTIGFICEQFNFAGVEVDAITCKQFLGGIIAGSREKENMEIVLESIKALRNSLAFLKPIIGEAIFRDEIFNLLMVYINSDNYSQFSYEALDEFCKSAYDYLNPYMSTIISMTIDHIRKRNETTVQALEVLDTIGSEYINRCEAGVGRTNMNQNINYPNYLTPLQDQLLPEVMSCLLIDTQDDLDFPEMRNSAVKTASTFVNMGNHETMSIIYNGVSTILASTNIGHLQASAILLSTLCESSDKPFAFKKITELFDQVLTLLNSAEPIVITNTLSGLSSIAEYYPEIFLDHAFIKAIIEKLFSFMNLNNPNITTSVLTIFKNMSEGIHLNSLVLSDPETLLTPLVNYFEQMLNNFEGQNKEYSEKVLISIMNCIMKIRVRETLVFMVEFLINKYEELYSQNHPDIEIMLQHVISVMHTSILALESTVPKMDLLQKICGVIDSQIRRFGIEEEGINLIGAMCISFNRNFEHSAERYWPHVMHALEGVNQHKTFRAALQCVGDYSRIYQESFVDRLHDIMSRLLTLIHQTFDRSLKCHILSCIGDLALGLGRQTDRYIVEIIKICDLCFGAVYQLSNIPNQKEYVEELNKTLIDMYSCVAYSLHYQRESSRPADLDLLNHFPVLATFVVRTCSREQSPTIDYLKACLELVFDLVSFYWKMENNRQYLKQVIENDQIRNLVSVLDNFTDREDIREVRSIIQKRYAFGG